MAYQIFPVLLKIFPIIAKQTKNKVDDAIAKVLVGEKRAMIVLKAAGWIVDKLKDKEESEVDAMKHGEPKNHISECKVMLKNAAEHNEVKPEQTNAQRSRKRVKS